MSRLPALLLVCTLVPSVGRAEDWLLSIEVVRESDRIETAGEPPTSSERSTARQTVRLGPTSVVVESAESTRILDFGRRREVVVDVAGKTFDELPLVVQVAARAAEFRNRTALGGILERAGIEGQRNPIGTFDSECALGLEKEPGAEHGLATRTEEGTTTWTREEVVVTRLVAGRTGLPAEAAVVFDLLLRYEGHLHPSIRRVVSAAPTWPALLEYRLVTPGRVDRFRWTFESIARVESRSPEMPADLRFRPRVPDGMRLLIESLRSDRCPPVASAEDVEKEVEEALGNGRRFDAALVLLDRGLSTGAMDGERLRQAFSSPGDDERFAAFLGTLQPRSREEAEAAVRTLTEMDRTGLSRPHVIDVMLAGLLQSLGQKEESARRLQAVVTASPTFAGAWIDLGQMFQQAFRSDVAWHCWEAARRIAPAHPMLGQIDEFELLLRIDHLDWLQVTGTDAADRTTCRERLGLQLLAFDRFGRGRRELPPIGNPSLFEALGQTLPGDGLFRCPAGDDEPIGYRTWRSGSPSASLVAKQGHRIPILWDRSPDRHGGVRHVAFFCGHVVEMEESEFRQRIEELAGRLELEIEPDEFDDEIEAAASPGSPCRRNMEALFVAIESFQAEHNDFLPEFGNPDFLESLRTGGFLGPAEPSCPARREAGVGYETWSGGTKITSGTLARYGSQIPILWDAEGHGHERHVLFLCGHVAVLDETEFGRRLTVAASLFGLER